MVDNVFVFVLNNLINHWIDETLSDFFLVISRVSQAVSHLAISMEIEPLLLTRNFGNWERMCDHAT